MNNLSKIKNSNNLTSIIRETIDREERKPHIRQLLNLEMLIDEALVDLPSHLLKIRNGAGKTIEDFYQDASDSLRSAIGALRVRS